MKRPMRKNRAKAGVALKFFSFFASVFYAGTATGRHSGAPSAKSASPPASKT
jgi:hypothetical protein